LTQLVVSVNVLLNVVHVAFGMLGSVYVVAADVVDV
jgi:hypothetical protein